MELHLQTACFLGLRPALHSNCRALVAVRVGVVTTQEEKAEIQIHLLQLCVLGLCKFGQAVVQAEGHQREARLQCRVWLQGLIEQTFQKLPTQLHGVRPHRLQLAKLLAIGSKLQTQNHLLAATLA